MEMERKSQRDKESGIGMKLESRSVENEEQGVQKVLPTTHSSISDDPIPILQIPS
jgi:hypothetical protein